jgi:hypothetical protein
LDTLDEVLERILRRSTRAEQAQVDPDPREVVACVLVLALEVSSDATRYRTDSAWAAFALVIVIGVVGRSPRGQVDLWLVAWMTRWASTAGLRMVPSTDSPVVEESTV